MTSVVIYDLESGERYERSFSTDEMEVITARMPTCNDLILQEIAALRSTITDDIRDRALLGDVDELKCIYDKINELKIKLTNDSAAS